MIRRGLSLLALVLAVGVATADEHHDGYYHPPVTSEEHFSSDLITPDGTVSSAQERIHLITTLTVAQIAQPDSPHYVFFIKGENDDELFLIGLDSEVFKTLYRARAVLAQMSTKIRGGNFFRESDLRAEATFFDLLAILGFRSLVVSDGDTWAHRVIFSREEQKK